MTFLSQFASEAATQESVGGVAALGLNLQGFIFQLISFTIILLLLRKFVYSKFVETLEERRLAVVASLDDAKEAARELEKTGEKTAEILENAKKEANEIVALARTEAAKAVSESEEKAKKRADHLIEQAESRLKQDIETARDELRKEMLHLVTDATEKVLRQKVDTATDKQLIERAIKEAN
jgi:F-type H+-transporting ATPase subunit b